MHWSPCRHIVQRMSVPSGPRSISRGSRPTTSAAFPPAHQSNHSRYDADLRLLPLRPLADAQHGHARLGGFPQLRDRMLVQYRASRKHDVRIRRLAETKLPIYSLRPPQIGLVEEVYRHLAVQAQLDDVDQLVPQRRIGPEIRGRLRGEAADGPDDRRGRICSASLTIGWSCADSRPSFSMPCHRLLPAQNPAALRLGEPFHAVVRLGDNGRCHAHHQLPAENSPGLLGGEIQAAAGQRFAQHTRSAQLLRRRGRTEHAKVQERMSVIADRRNN